MMTETGVKETVGMQCHSLSYFYFLHNLLSNCVFAEYTFDKLSAFEGFIKIHTFKKVAVWKLGPSKRRD